MFCPGMCPAATKCIMCSFQSREEYSFLHSDYTKTLIQVLQKSVSLKDFARILHAYPPIPRKMSSARIAPTVTIDLHEARFQEPDPTYWQPKPYLRVRASMPQVPLHEEHASHQVRQLALKGARGDALSAYRGSAALTLIEQCDTDICRQSGCLLLSDMSWPCLLPCCCTSEQGTAPQMDDLKRSPIGSGIFAHVCKACKGRLIDLSNASS